MVNSGNIYCRADAKDITMAHNDMAKNRHIPPHQQGRQYACRHVLPVGLLNRLEGFEAMWAAARQEMQGRPELGAR